MKTTSICIFLALCFAFGNSVTTNYAPDNVAWVTSERIRQVAEERPAYPFFCDLNTKLKPETRVFQSGFDEYRAWCTFDLRGRHNWEESWLGYTDKFERNTAWNLCQWLNWLEMDFIIVKPGDEFELPLWDRDFDAFFMEVGYIDMPLERCYLYQVGVPSYANGT